MTEILYTSGTGAIVQEQRLAILTNNIANANTAGFKADRISFRSYLPGEEKDDAGGKNASPAGLKPERTQFAVQFDGTRTDFSQGVVHNTGNTLDVAIIGDGFFSIQTQDGVEYTRNGQFSLSSDGTLVTQHGHPVLGDGGPIQLDGGSIKIGLDGTISVDDASVGRLALVSFDAPELLEKSKGTRFKAPEGVNPAGVDAATTVRQGAIEQANVNAVEMMTEMIEVLRAYESHQRVMRTSDETTAKVINDVGRPT